MNSTAQENNGSLIGLAPLMTMACNGVDLAPLGRDLLERAGRDAGPASANLLMDVSAILQMRGSPEVGLAMQQQALEFTPLYRLPSKQQPAIRLLALKFPGLLSANTPLEFLVEDSDIELTMLYVSPDLPLPQTLPEHDIMFVAVGQSEERLTTLKFIERLAATWPRPVLNRPERISLLSRDATSALLHSSPGVVIPNTIRVKRTVAEAMVRGEVGTPSMPNGFEFPLIIRPVDSHAGHSLIKADNMAAISEYLAEKSDTEFYVAPFIDYRSEDGQFRKYRVAFIDGRPYAGHMAISDHWMIHYLSGGMDASAEKRAEEEHFISNFEQDFASRHHAALRCIAERMKLDYLIMDCAETKDGKLLIFEVDSSAVIHAMDPVETFPYKKPQLDKIVAAFRAMLGKAAGSFRPSTAV